MLRFRKNIPSSYLKKKRFSDTLIPAKPVPRRNSTHAHRYFIFSLRKLLYTVALVGEYKRDCNLTKTVK